MLARLQRAASSALPRLLHQHDGALAAFQARAASSHSENTNTFLREVRAWPTSGQLCACRSCIAAVHLDSPCDQSLRRCEQFSSAGFAPASPSEAADLALSYCLQHT